MANEHISRLRRLRGKDDAVNRIGDMKKLSKLLAGEGTREEIILATMATYSGKAYGDQNWPTYTGGWTTPKVPTLYGEFREKWPNLDALSLDPGFITHLPEFRAFVESTNDVHDPKRVRAKFKEYLGFRDVYRGMVLSQGALEQILHEGIPSSFLTQTRNKPEQLEQFEAHVLSSYIWSLVEGRFHNEDYESPFVSVTSHQDVAIAVGRHFGSGEPGRLYVFHLRVPEIDCIPYSEHEVLKPEKLKRHAYGKEPELIIGVDGEDFFHPWDKHTESFVIHKINADEIKDVTMPSVTESSWNGRVNARPESPPDYSIIIPRSGDAAR